jgi:hypothetical protein
MTKHTANTEAMAERRRQIDLQRHYRIESMGPLLFLKDDNDAFAHEGRIRKLGCWATIYSTWDYGFAKPGASKPSWDGIMMLNLHRSWPAEEHALVWDAVSDLLGGGFDRQGHALLHICPAANGSRSHAR